MTHLLDGMPDPRNPPNSQACTSLNKRLTRKIKTYRIKDPPVNQEKSTLLGIIHSIVAAATSSYDPKAHHIVNLVELGFYFCLRSCEYTKCTYHHQTVQFRPLLEFVLFVGDILLPVDALIKHFRQAT